MKKLLITMGDPGGVGPEIIAQALSAPVIRKTCIPIVISDTRIMAKALRLLRHQQKLREITVPEEAENIGRLMHIINVRTMIPQMGPQKKLTAEGGEACVSYIRKAVELAMHKQVDGMVTAPISKEALKMAGFAWPGHTELLAELTRTPCAAE